MELQIDSKITPPVASRPRRKYRKVLTRQMARELAAMSGGQSVLQSNPDLVRAIRAWFDRKGISYTSQSEEGGVRIWRLE